MFRDETCLERFAAVLVGASIAGAATGGLALAPGVGEALGAGAGLLVRLSGQRRTDAERVLRALQRDLEAEWRAWGAHSSHADEGLRASVVASFEEVIPVCATLPAEVVGLRLDADAIAAKVLAKAEAARPEVYADPDPRNTDAHLARSFLVNVTCAAYARLLSEPGYIDQLAPQLWRDVLAWQGRMEAKQDAQTEMLQELLARTAPSLPLATAKAILAEFGHGEAPDDPAAIERLLRTAAEQYRLFAERLRELDNSGDLMVRDLLREAEALVAQGRFDAADARLIEAEHHADLARAKVRANRGDLAKLRRRYRDAANHYAAAAAIVPDDALPARWRYQVLRAIALCDLGREYGDNGALIEAISLYADTALLLASRNVRPFDWATTQMNLGNALATLGERESGTGRLEQAVTAYHAALEEITRDRLPLDWARTQMNLGNTLRALGERESGTARLEQAVTAYRAALEERTRERVPLDWATTQMNLGNTLATLGRRESGAARLEQAVAAYRAALEERTRGRVPLDWAMTQMNLGNALQILGGRESGTARLEQAVAAYCAALEEMIRERVPLDWAMATGNQGVALRVLAERTSDATIARQALDQVAAAEAVMRAGGHVPNADYYADQLPAAAALVAKLAGRGTGLTRIIED